MKYDLGLFDDPYRFCRQEAADSIICCQEHLNESRRMAAESFVLLKNKDNILPLNPEMKIALIGPFADDAKNILGSWTARGGRRSGVTILEGLREVCGNKVVAEPGCDICYDADLQKYWCWYRPVERLADASESERRALKAAKSADVIVAAMGEPALLTGEAASRVDIVIPDAQKDLLKKLAGLGKPVVLLLFTGRQIDLRWENEHLDAILNCGIRVQRQAERLQMCYMGKQTQEGVFLSLSQNAWGSSHIITITLLPAILTLETGRGTVPIIWTWTYIRSILSVSDWITPLMNIRTWLLLQKMTESV